jgi:hypothetical protein
MNYRGPACRRHLFRALSSQSWSDGAVSHSLGPESQSRRSVRLLAVLDLADSLAALVSGAQSVFALPVEHVASS